MNLLYVADAPTPYRLHFMQRIHHELGADLFATYFTHSHSNAPWSLSIPSHLKVHFVGQGNYGVSPHKHILRDYRTGGAVIRAIHAAGPNTGVFMGGYGDAGRARIISWCHHNGVPLFIFGDSNIRSDQAKGPARAAKQLLLRWVEKRITCFMACGSLGADFYASYGCPRQKILYCPYEPDYAQIQSLPQSKIDDVARHFGFRPDRRRLIYSGRLIPVKRVDLLLQAFAQIADARPEWDLVVAGGGTLEQQLKSSVPPALSSRVQWLGFQNDQSTVSAIYRNCHALCLPSEYEPWALVINEAAAAGLAIIASDVVGAAAELVREGVNGKTFKNKDLSDLASALAFVTDPSRIDSLRAASPHVLSDWRHRGDPIEGLRKGFRLAGIPTPPPSSLR
jgi:glycosyltransferase involved in cell wall biosynthesis